MSYEGDAASGHYIDTDAVSIASDQPLLLVGWIKPLVSGARHGLMCLGTAGTTIAGNGEDPFGLSVRTNNRVEPQYEAGSVTTFNSLVVADSAWSHIGAFIANGFDGTSQTVRGYLNGSSQDATVTLPDYSGANFDTVQCGSAAFSEVRHNGAYMAIYNPADLAAADAIIAELQTKAPADTAATALATFPFVNAEPAGFTSAGTISIDSGDNPPISTGGAGLRGRVIRPGR